MRITAVSLRDFRCYDEAQASLGPRLTVVTGPNGAGKTNLVEGVYFGCTGRSCRTTNDREVVRFGSGAARVVVTGEAEDGEHEFAVGFAAGEAKRMRVDGAAVERMLDVPNRPLISVFLPDRLELIKGAPALRRAHLDQFISALWPSRTVTRRSYAQALAQRNALVARIRGGGAPRSALTTWDRQLAGYGIELMGDRRQAAEQLREPFARIAEALGLGGEPSLEYRPRSRAQTAEELAEELAARTSSDLERGFTGHGPHRDDLVFRRDAHDLRTYGSQGQQRLALLGLLLAERDVLAAARRAAPVMLLDDVMSELDATRRSALVTLLREADGQSILTATDLDHIPGAGEDDVVRVAVADGRVLAGVPA